MRRETDTPAEQRPEEPDVRRVHEIDGNQDRVDDDVGDQVILEALVLKRVVHGGLHSILRSLSMMGRGAGHIYSRSWQTRMVYSDFTIAVCGQEVEPS